MKKFEHRLIQTDAFGEERINMLTRMGEKGWELVSYTTPVESPKSPGYWFVDMVFKRIKAEDESNNSTRINAMAWWSRLSLDGKSKAVAKKVHLESGGFDASLLMRDFDSYTGREIQMIYERITKP